jgi:HpcH/HpaI aldolase/citrate lyase family
MMACRMDDRFEYAVFQHDVDAVRQGLAAGLRTFIVDGEWRGKHARQEGWDTQIAAVPLAAVAPVAVLPGASIWCRINELGPWMQEEIDVAIDGGAGRIFLPMVRDASDGEALVRAIAGRAEAAILVETPEALAALHDIAQLPLAAVYVGLNDLAIGRGSQSIFDAIADGTVERIRDAMPDVEFGFAGVTVVDGGDPVPCALLLAEMERLGAGFGFLRRSYHQDIRNRNVRVEIARLDAHWAMLRRRSAAERVVDRNALLDCLRHGCAVGR